MSFRECVVTLILGYFQLYVGMHVLIACADNVVRFYTEKKPSTEEMITGTSLAATIGVLLITAGLSWIMR